MTAPNLGGTRRNDRTPRRIESETSGTKRVTEEEEEVVVVAIGAGRGRDAQAVAVSVLAQQLKAAVRGEARPRLEETLLKQLVIGCQGHRSSRSPLKSSCRGCGRN